MIKTRKHQAFSLIEISVVIIVVGILLAGISSGIELYDDYRFKVAQNLTKNSLVSRIPDLKLWLETTSEKAFKVGTTANISDYKNIAVPNDQQDIGVWQEDVATKYPQEIAYQLNDFKPSYVKNGIGGLPSLYFDGKDNVNGDFMSFDGSLLSVWEDGFTIFVVERRTALPTVDTYQFLLSSSAISVGYNNATWIRIKAVGVSGFGTITSQKNQDRIHCHYQNTISDVIKISVNKKNYSGTTGLATTKIANGTAQIAQYSSYTGLISEIIIFARPLSTKELENIHLYLSNKYKIRLE